MRCEREGYGLEPPERHPEGHPYLEIARDSMRDGKWEETKAETLL